MNYKKKINSHYNQLIMKYGFSKSGIGWKSDKLNIRFSKFLNHLNFEKLYYFRLWSRFRSFL